MNPAAQHAYVQALAFAKGEVEDLIGKKAVIEYRITQLETGIKVLEEKLARVASEEECQPVKA